MLILFVTVKSNVEICGTEVNSIPVLELQFCALYSGFKKLTILKNHHFGSTWFSQLLVLMYQENRVIRATQAIEEKIVEE